MYIDRDKFRLREHCHVNTNEDGDRFVGVKVDSVSAGIYFPMGYQLPDDDDELRRDVKNLFEILATFTERNDKVLHVENFTELQLVDFPIQAYLNVINYYLDRNGTYYNEVEPVFKVGRKGKPDFKRTIQKLKPIVQDSNFIYLDMVLRDTTPNFNKLITKIHKYCVYESFHRIGWIYTTNKPEIPNFQFEKECFVSTLNDKIGNTNKDEDRRLFLSMIAMIEFMDNHTVDRQFYFGTDKFEYVWEKLIDIVFGESNKSEYFPRGLWVERFGYNKGKHSSALEPDSIMIYNEKIYVLDAKYYRYGIAPELGINGLPRSSDINKQITYGEYVKNNKTPNGEEVFNAFIMPYNMHDNAFDSSGEYLNVAEATGNWRSIGEYHERVQGVVMDTRHLLKNYLGNHDRDKEKLSKEIEKNITL